MEVGFKHIFATRYLSEFREDVEKLSFPLKNTNIFIYKVERLNQKSIDTASMRDLIKHVQSWDSVKNKMI
jgi:hypothetical protein